MQLAGSSASGTRRRVGAGRSPALAAAEGPRQVKQARCADPSARPRLALARERLAAVASEAGSGSLLGCFRSFQRAKPSRLAGFAVPRCNAHFRVAKNEPTLRTTLQTLASKWGVEVAAANSGVVDEGGISLGSNQALHLKAPRVLLMWGAPTSSPSAGWARYVLERRFNQPVSAIRVSTMRRVDLRKFDVIVMPQGNYEGVLGDGYIMRIKDFVRAGGTPITIGEASRWALRDKAGFDYNRAITPERPRPDVIAGALLRGSLDTEHWLSAGLDAEFQVMVEGQRVFTPIKLDKGVNVGVYATADKLGISGILWKENKDSFAQKAFLRRGTKLPRLLAGPRNCSSSTRYYWDRHTEGSPRPLWK